MRSIVLVFSAILVLTFVSCEKESSDGKSSLLDLVVEPAGENCSEGGYRINSGIDQNGNGILDQNEILNSEYLCNGESGSNGMNGQTSLINITEENPGEYCSYGGIKLESGLDNNNNGILDEDEIQSINYVCNGADGQSNGTIKVVRLPFTLAYKWRTANTNWSSEVEDGLLYNFNINNYQNFDSIIFISQFFRMPFETTDRLWLRLYDYTEGVGIEGSELYSDLPNPEITNPNSLIFKSDNFYNSILEGNMTIGIQFKKEISEIRKISIHSAEIILYKNY